MSKAQVEELKTLTAKSLKLIKQFLQETFPQIKLLPLSENKVINTNDESTLPKSISEFLNNKQKLQEAFNYLKENVASTIKSMKDIYNELNTSEYFSQRLQQEASTLLFLLSIPNRTIIIESYITLIRNIITNTSSTNNMSSKIEMINNMITTTQYEFND